MNNISKSDINQILTAIKKDAAQAIELKNCHLLEKCVINVCSLLKQQMTEETSSELFMFLDQLQTVVAKWLFKDGDVITPLLLEFVQKCDRLDDVDLRNHILRLIQEGNFLK